MDPDEQLVYDNIPETGTIHIAGLKQRLIDAGRYDLVRLIPKMKRRKILHYTKGDNNEMAHVARGPKVYGDAS